jgi:RecA-family ATPase
MNTNQEVNQHRFKLIPFAKILVSKTSAYLVKGLIPRTGLVVIWGPAKCGKSFFIFDLVMHIVLGWAAGGLYKVPSYIWLWKEVKASKRA